MNDTFRVCRAIPHAAPAPPVDQPGIRRRAGDEAAAYRMWMIAGTMGLSAWLGATAERDIGHRRFTVTEYGEWSAVVRAMELKATGTNSEFRSGI